CRRRNCQTMAEELQESNQQRLHHFITVSKWGFQRVMDTVTLRFWKRLEDLDLAGDSCLIIDEYGNPKKGKRSAGVKRQYCGQVGKKENCQVGVFGALCGGVGAPGLEIPYGTTSGGRQETTGLVSRKRGI